MSITNILPSLTGEIKPKSATPQAPKANPPSIFNPSQQSVIIRSSGGGNSRKVSTPILADPAKFSNPSTATTAKPNQITAPEYSGNQGWGNVADTYKLIGMKTANIFGANYDLSPKGSSIGKDGSTSFFTSPLFVFGAPAAVAATPLLFGGSAATSTAATTAARTGVFSALRSSLFAGGAGLLAGGLLFGGKTTQSQDQNTTTVTNTTTYQTTNTSQDTYNTQYVINSPNAAPQLFGNPSQNVAPSQSVTPSVDVNPSQSQTSGMDWGMIALIAGGVFLLSRGNK